MECTYHQQYTRLITICSTHIGSLTLWDSDELISPSLIMLEEVFLQFIVMHCFFTDPFKEMENFKLEEPKSKALHPCDYEVFA